MKNYSSSIKKYVEKQKTKIKNIYVLKIIKNYYKKNLANLSEKTNFINAFRDFLESKQDQLEKHFDDKDQNVLLKQSPYYAKAITWTLLGSSALGFLWLGIAKTEEIIIVQGKLEPISKVVDVQIPIGGVVQQVLVKESESVEKDQLLITLDKKSISSKVDSLTKILEINKNILKKLELLMNEGAVSELQYLQKESQIRELESQLTQEKVFLSYQEIRAPIKGKIFELKPTIKGFVTKTSEPVMQIVPNDYLKAKVEIDSRKIGFVSTGKSVDISIDSYPATDFGVIKGEVQRIGLDALPPDPSQNKNYRFPADISLESQFLKLKNKKTLPLQVGMSLTANIKLRKVSYLQLLLGTFQNKADSLRSL